MKSLVFIILLTSSSLFAAEQQGRFEIDPEKMTVLFFGEAKIDKNAEQYGDVEKRAWADAVQYLYSDFNRLDAFIDFPSDGKSKRVSELVSRLRSRNTTYFKGGVVRVTVEFNYKGFEKSQPDPFAAYKKTTNTL